MSNLARLAFCAALPGLALAPAARADHLMIDVEGATIKDGAIVFPAVRIDMDGYVVIHAVADGAPTIPGSIGHATVPAGTTALVAVPVQGGAMAGADYVAMIHYETNGNGTYDFGEGMTDVDTPGMRPDGTPYFLPFKAAM